MNTNNWYFVYAKGNPIAGFEQKHMANGFALIVDGVVGGKNGADPNAADIDDYIASHEPLANHPKIARIKAIRIMYGLELFNAKEVHDKIFSY